MSPTAIASARARVDPARVRAMRLKAGIHSKSRAVGMVGVNFKTVWLWEDLTRAPFLPREKTLTAFAAAYKCQPEDFYAPVKAQE